MNRIEIFFSSPESCLFLAAVAVTLLPAPLPAIAQKADSQEYRKTVTEALAEFEIGNYEEACSLFRQAHRLNPNARTSRGIGVASFEARRYVDAILALQAALDDSRKPLTKKQREEAQGLLQRARGFVGSLSVRVEPDTAELKIDGRDPVIFQDRVILDPGQKQLVAKAEGYRTLIRQVSILGGNEQTLELTLEPLVTNVEQEAKPTGAHPSDESVEIDEITSERATDPEQMDEDIDLLPWLVLGGSGTMMVAGAVFLALAQSDISTVENASDGTNWRDIEAANDRAPALSAVGFVLLGMGAAGAVTGIVLLTSGTSNEGSTIGLRLTPNGIALGGKL